MTPTPSNDRPRDYETPIRVHPPVELDFADGLTAEQRSWPVGEFERVERPVSEKTLDFAEPAPGELVVTVRPPVGRPLDPLDMADLTGVLDALRRKGYRVDRQSGTEGAN
ncbi:MAG TPA: hypothetical protein VFG68_02435 [Fimbriiglobus sp.]|nr:hypothetical protein [Fimbriiglobus sp.]